MPVDARAGTSSGQRVLVTGASGFVGRHLLAWLRGPEDAGDVILRAGRETDCDVYLDLADPASVRAAIVSSVPDVVFHLAGQASVAQSDRSAAATWQINLVGTMALAEALGKANPAATMLFTSSAEVYRRAFLDGAADEKAAPWPSSVYAQAKLAAEQMLAAVLPNDATLIIARPSNHIGPGQGAHFALPSFASQLVAAERAGKSALIRVGNLDTQRDFMDVRDVVRAYGALLRYYAGSCARVTFNISSGRTRSIRSLLDMLRDVSHVTSEVVVDPTRSRPSEVPVAAIDSTELRMATAWSPTMRIEQSIADIMSDARMRQDDSVSVHAG